MIGFEILLSHLFGDYILQNDWMANEKTKRWLPAIIHAFIYGCCYAVWLHSVPALLVIAVSHGIIDHFRLVKPVIWAVNQIAPKASRYTWESAKATGYSPNTPPWMAVWLMIIVDNTWHLAINFLSIKYL